MSGSCKSVSILWFWIILAIVEARAIVSSVKSQSFVSGTVRYSRKMLVVSIRVLGLSAVQWGVDRDRGMC